MIRALVTVAVIAALALVGTLTVAPSWPVVVALAVIAFVAVAVFAGTLWADRDTRLDVEARKDAHRAKLIADEYVKRLSAIEDWQRGAQSRMNAQALKAPWMQAAGS